MIKMKAFANNSFVINLFLDGNNWFFKERS